LCVVTFYLRKHELFHHSIKWKTMICLTFESFFPIRSTVKQIPTWLNGLTSKSPRCLNRGYRICTQQVACVLLFLHDNWYLDTESYSHLSLVANSETLWEYCLATSDICHPKEPLSWTYSQNMANNWLLQMFRIKW
jgi:hypothetical protein